MYNFHFSFENRKKKKMRHDLHKKQTKERLEKKKHKKAISEQKVGAQTSWRKLAGDR